MAVVLYTDCENLGVCRQSEALEGREGFILTHKISTGFLDYAQVYCEQTLK
jgi:hypothetical protein